MTYNRENNLGIDVYNEVIENNLVLPNREDYEVIDQVKEFVLSKETEKSASFLPCPLYVAKKKALLTVRDFYGIEAYYHAQCLLKDIQIKNVGDKGEYHIDSAFSNEYVSLIVPDKLDTLSNVYISRELLRGMKDKNPKEYIFKYKFGKVISFFHELAQSYSYNERKCDFIIKNRLDSIKNNILFEKQDIIDNPTLDVDALKLLFLEKDSDVLSYYYAVLLFSIYLKRPYDVMDHVKEVVNGKRTTLSLLNYYGLLELHNLEEFERTSHKLDKKALR